MSDVLKSIFLTVLLSSAAGSIMALFVILIKLLLKTKVSPRIYCILWFFVAVKLIITPFAPSSNISMFNLLNYKENTTPNILSATKYMEEQQKQLWDSATKNKQYINYNTLKTKSQMNQTKDNYITKRNIKPDILLIVSVIWIFGFIFIMSLMIYFSAVFSKKIKTAGKISNFELPFDNIPVFSSSFVASPCLLGIIKPKIYIPQNLPYENEQQITHILIHEFAHYKRKDNLINIFIATANALNWFNPIIWLAFKQYRLDREISCDTYALEILGQKEAVPYGMTLINYPTREQTRQSVFNLNFCETKHQIKRPTIKSQVFFRKKKYFNEKDLISKRKRPDENGKSEKYEKCAL